MFEGWLALRRNGFMIASLGVAVSTDAQGTALMESPNKVSFLLVGG